MPDWVVAVLSVKSPQQSRDIVSPTLPALSPRYGAGRGSGRGDRKAGILDNPSAAATQAHAGSAFGKGCVYRQGDRTRQDRLRNRHRCYLHSNPGHGHQAGTRDAGT